MHNTSVSSSPGFFGFVLEHRTQFLIRIYEHLLLALVAFISTELVLFRSGLATALAQFTQGIHWLLIATAFVLIAWLGREATRQADSLVMQYLAFFSCVIAQAIIFVPLLLLAEWMAVGVMQSADIVALLGVIGLIAIVLGMRNNFTIGRTLPAWYLATILLFMIARYFLGGAPGVLVSVGTVSVAGILILCQTAVLLHKKVEEYPIPVALELFTVIALPLDTLRAIYQYLRQA